ncbi:MAG: ABC transporter ATP-binding protein [Eubacterium sp.]|nr:ABC transporter ATP-binding protein [Eubacterium sp.]MCI8718837.1 ABC transporter ATP-binding protein [Lachnospiraceae bacterium]MCI8826274.1 ABC transporter ATP-binding protein [Lachnospiraceae bacterium]
MLIEVCDYTKIIHKVTILEHVNCVFHSGVCYGLKGKNGSGKTMLMRAVCGLINPTSGYVSIDGKVIGKDISFPENVGLLLENPVFPGGYTGLKNLELLASIQKRVSTEEIREVLKRVGLEPDDKRRYKKYSLGMKQKLGIAAAFMEKAPIIILDEPINAIDADGVERVKQMIQEAKDRGAVLITACHNAEELEQIADEIIEISEGKII